MRVVRVKADYSIKVKNKSVNFKNTEGIPTQFTQRWYPASLEIY